jgi:hypothetical protein
VTCGRLISVPGMEVVTAATDATPKLRYTPLEGRDNRASSKDPR